MGDARSVTLGRERYDATVVGSGPNGLATAITLAQAGHSVLVIEAEETIGGGLRSAELTLPGFVHDICSAIHPLGVASPFFRELPLTSYGLEWIYPPIPAAHPFDDGTVTLLERSVRATAESLGRDAVAYRRMMQPLVDDWEWLLGDVLGPLPLPPRHPVALARFGLKALWPAHRLAEQAFQGERARALFAGLAAHAMLPLEQPASAAFGLVMATVAHAVGWPLVRGGSQAFAKALSAYLHSLGGEIITGWRIEAMDQLPPSRAILFDVTPRQLLSIAGDRFPSGYKRALSRYRYGPGVFKVDWALDGPIPWRAADCRRAATVHLGATLAEISASERAVGRGKPPERPYVIVVQQSLFDPARAPEGKHTGWAYCHVPNGSDFDMTERIEGQVERFAPGFRERIRARSVMPPAAMECHNANYIGGDINGGIQDLRQLYARPVARWSPYSTPAGNLYLCSSSTPPGGGVHGMCGYYAAQAALRSLSRGK